MNDSIAEEPQQVTSSVSVGNEDKSKAVVAVSVSQVCKLTRPNEGLVLHGKKVYHVSLIALVYDILDISSQKIHVLLDDYTGGGPLEASHIIGDGGIPDSDNGMSMYNDNPNNGDGARNLIDLKQGDYIRCIGVVKYSQDRANLVVYNMRFVDDPNEITMHTLEVIRDSMAFERSSAGKEPVNQSAGKQATDSNKSGMPTYQQQQSKNDFGKLSTRDKHLLKFLKEKGGESGIKQKEIEGNFKAFSANDIKESLAVLCEEGLAWQGDQEDIWCVAADF